MRFSPKRLSVVLVVCLLAQCMLWLKPPTASALHVNPNLLANPGFELTTGGTPDNWQAIGGWGGSQVTLSAAAARSGDYGVSISSGAAANPWVMQKIPIVPGNTYDFTAWFKSSGVEGKGVVLKVEFYKDQPTDNWVSGHFGPYIRNVTGDWQPYSFRMKAPEEAEIAYVYLRLWGTGTVWFDDAAARLVNLTMATDSLIYYTDETEGRVQVETRFSDDDYTDKTVDITLTDTVTETVIDAVYGLDAEPQMSHLFDPTEMTPERAYRVDVVLRGPDSSIWDEETALIYRWARPTTLPAGGVLQSDGEPFFPVIAYHVDVEQYPMMQQIGVNTIQGPKASSLAALRGAMDAAEQAGLKMLVPLYYYMSIRNDIDKMEEYVTELKDHPALLGWMAIDEPSGNGVPVEVVRDVYKTVRAIDPDHPIYMVEGSAEEYANYARVPDIFTVDVYPLPSRPITNVGDRVRDAVEVAPAGRPVWSILQTFAYPPPSAWTYLPTITEVRSMAYQSLLGGATGLGYYAINDTNWSLPDSFLWQGLIDFKPELEWMAERAFTPPVDLHNGEEEQWAIWQDEESGELYVVVLNETNAPANVAVPVPANGYHAELLYGDLPASFDDPGHVLNVSLPAYGTFLYKLTPFAGLAAKAAHLLDEAQALSANAHWTAETVRLSGELEALAVALGNLASPPNADTIAAAAADVIGDAAVLQAWVAVQPDPALGGDRAAMTAALVQAAETAMPLAGSPAAIELAIAQADAVVIGEQTTVQVSVLNRGSADMEDAMLTLRFPDSFGLPPIIEPIGDLDSQDSFSGTYTLPVPLSVGEAVYRLVGEITFPSGGTSVAAGASSSFRAVPLLGASLASGAVTLNRPENVPFTAVLSNRSAHPVTASLDALGTAEIGVDAGAAVTIPAGDSVTVHGSVYLMSDSVADGTYAISLVPRAGVQTFDELTLLVNVMRNMAANPGFEQGNASGTAPISWNVGKGVWDADTAHSGARSVRLDPDSGNANNFIASSAIELVPGRSYTLSGWLKNESTSGTVSFGMRYANAAGSTISYQLQAVTSSPNWSYVSIPLTIPAGTARGYVNFRMNTAANGSAWLDDVELRETAPTP